MNFFLAFGARFSFKMAATAVVPPKKRAKTVLSAALRVAAEVEEEVM